jgi:D-alanyl-D-alanine carboxypeptidase
VQDIQQRDRVPERVAPVVNKILAREGVAHPRILVTDDSGETLVSVGQTSLPVMVGGITKLVTLAMVFREFDRGALTPDTPLVDVLPEESVEGLCVIKGVDYSSRININHLLSHTSGIRDYLSPGAPNTISLLDQINSRDRSWGTREALEISRHYPGVFVPGAGSKIHYSNTNFLLLGAALEASTGMAFDQLVNLRIASPLELGTTYVFTPQHFDRYFSLAPLTMKEKTLRIPRALSSFGPAGGLVTSPKDMVVFLRSFWRGELFSTQWLDGTGIKPLRLDSGVGFANGLMMTTRGSQSSRYIGHSGLSGCVALIDTTRGRFGFLATNTMTPRAIVLRELSAILSVIP